MKARQSENLESKWIEGTETVTNQNYLNVGNFGRNLNRYDRSGFDRPRYQSGFSNQTSVTIPRRWPNPAYDGPGPLTIVNPYCRPTTKE